MSAAKRKGTAAETAVVRFLQANGWPQAERRALAGAADRGDVAGLPVVVEVKNAARMELAAWLDEAVKEAGQRSPYYGQVPPSDGTAGVVWHKRRGKASPGDWYVTCDGWTLLAFLQALKED
jgi:hypothetical protein